MGLAFPSPTIPSLLISLSALKPSLCFLERMFFPRGALEKDSSSHPIASLCTEEETLMWWKTRDNILALLTLVGPGFLSLTTVKPSASERAKKLMERWLCSLQGILPINRHVGDLQEEKDYIVSRSQGGL